MSALRDASELIDCDHERTLFEKIVQEAECVRLLTIHLGKKRGKSSLLNWFENEAQDTFGVPAARVEFKGLADRSEYGVAQALVAGLQDWRLSFPEYDRLEKAFAARDWTSFASRSQAPQGHVNAVGAQLTDSFAAGSVGAVYQGGEHQHLHQHNEAPEFNGQQTGIARRACADAFLDDLRTITTTQRVLVLVDAWELCPGLVQRWLKMRLLMQHALDEQPTRITVILAGQAVPQVPARGRGSLVRSLTSLSSWDDDHIRRYLELRGRAADDSDFATIRKGLNVRGWTFDDLEAFIALIPKVGA